MPTRRLIIAATFALAACDSGPKDGPDHGNISNAPIAENEAAGGAGDATPNSAVPGGGNSISPADHVITGAFQGRWGMVPKDCGPDAAIAKGLMVVDGKQLRFYESVGKPALVTFPTPTRMEGRFTFTGEGMEWSKDMVLTIEGDKLVRTEKDPVASYEYTRCPG